MTDRILVWVVTGALHHQQYHIMKTIEKVSSENGVQLNPVKATPIPIPGSGLVSRIFNVPFDLQKTKFIRSLFDNSNRRTESVIVGDEVMEFTLPSFKQHLP